MSTEVRRDIEGLRAVAVLSVMIDHAGLPLRAGFVGVDVFFVISGFLITGVLLRELAATGTISWSRFLARRVRRLLPAAVLVLVTAAVVAFFVVPGLRRRDVGWDVGGAGTYLVNWIFADRSVNYLAADARPSPVQHYWSLSVEEQFYLGWPLLLVGLALLSRRFAVLRRGGRPRPAAIVGVLAIVTLASFGYAVWRAAVDPNAAYFVTTTRVWELGLGALLACWAMRPVGAPGSVGGPGRVGGLSRFDPLGQVEPLTATAARGSAPSLDLRARIGWIGLATIVASAALIPAEAAWPSWWTLLPTGGAAAVLWAGLPSVGGSSAGGSSAGGPGAGLGSGAGLGPGAGGSRAGGPVRLLGWPALGWIGGLSYSLYLWHWPVIVLAEWARETPLSLPWRVVLTAASTVPAYLGYRFVERPLHHGPLLASPRRALAVGAALSMSTVAFALPLALAGSVFVAPVPAGVDPATLGPRTLKPGQDPASVESWAWISPDPMSAGGDRPAADVDHCQLDRLASSPVQCVFGELTGPRTIALVGDSKALQWLPALESAAAIEGWRIVTYGKSLCPYSAEPTALEGRPYPSCDAFNQAVLAALHADPPDLVITSTANRGGGGGSGGRADTIAGLAAAWTDLRNDGIPVLVIGDNPTSPDDLDICAARHPQELTRCAFDRHTAVAGSALGVLAEAATRSGAPLLDLTDALCPGPRCPVVIGNVTVNRPGDHVTATYARSLAPLITPAVREAIATLDFGPGAVAK